MKHLNLLSNYSFSHGQSPLSCMLCPRACRVDRSEGNIGYCGETDIVRLSRAALYFYEEPCLTGKRGVGNIFFSGCSLRCVYCQNREIALGNHGKEITFERLVEIFRELQEKGAENMGLVTATHFVPTVVKAVEEYRDECEKEGIRPLKFIYNSSGYESIDTLEMLAGLIDIYLPDFKYMSPDRAKKYSNAYDYPEVAKAALAEMYRQVGGTIFTGDGMLSRGIVVRHLVLPLGTHDSMDVIKYLHDTYGDDIMISIMSQYTPLEGVGEKYPELGRRITRREYDRVVDFALSMGVTNAYIQERKVAEASFIPDFDSFEGV